MISDSYISRAELAADQLRAYRKGIGMIVGFSGSRKGMNTIQIMAVRNFLIETAMLADGKNDEFHHGDCLGADEEAYAIAKELGWKTIAHPAIVAAKWKAHTKSDIILPEYPPLIRNYHIVDTVDMAIVTPDTNFEILRSGTWAFIRYARSKNKIKEDHIFYPRG